MFAELSETILHAVDTALLGRVGTTEVAALVLADAVLGIWLIAALALSDALQIVVARRSGEGTAGAVGASFNHAFSVIVVLSIFLAVALKQASPVITSLVAEANDVAEAVDRFLQIAAFGLPFLAISFAYSAFYVGIARTRVLVIATVVLTAVNAGLGYALVLGKLGAPRLGLEGAAIASVVAEAATAIVLTAYTLRRKYALRYNLFRSPPRDLGIIRLLVVIGAPMALYGVIAETQWLLFFVILEQVGTEALAWSNVIYACLLMLLIPSEALSEVSVTVVSSTIGGGEEGRSREAVRRLLANGALATLPLAAVTFLAPAWVFSLFGAAVDPAPAVFTSLRLVAVGMIVAVPAMIWGGAVEGTGDTRAVAVFESIAAAVMLGWTFAAANHFVSTLPVIWAGLLLSWGVALGLSYGWMRTGRWRRIRV